MIQETVAGLRGESMRGKLKIKGAKWDARWLRAWFSTTPDERLVVAGILAIALIGLTARYWHLKHQAAEPYPPPEIGRFE